MMGRRKREVVVGGVVDRSRTRINNYVYFYYLYSIFYRTYTVALLEFFQNETENTKKRFPHSPLTHIILNRIETKNG